MTISERIFKILEEKNMTKCEFSKATHIAYSTISDWNMKKTNPSANKIMKICEVLEVSPEVLLQDTMTTNQLMGANQEELSTIKYRPHRNSLDNAMKEMKTFRDIADMLRYIEKETRGCVSVSDIVISQSYGEDERIGWTSWRYVLTTRYGNDRYDTPQVIGMCDLGEVK